MTADLLAGELSDSQAAVRVYLAAGGLVLLGLLLLLVTVRWWRGTRPEPPSLAPLEVMGERRWAAAPDPDRQRLLEAYRPSSGDRSTPIIEPEPLDLGALARDAPQTFDDLRDDGAQLGDARVVGPGALSLADVPDLVPVDDAPDEPVDLDGGVDAIAGLDAGVDDAEAADAVSDASLDETAALEADDDEIADAEAAGSDSEADESDELDELDEFDELDDVAVDSGAIDTGEHATYDEHDDDQADEAAEDEAADEPADHVDEVQQALSFDGDALVDQSTVGD